MESNSHAETCCESRSKKKGDYGEAALRRPTRAHAWPASRLGLVHRTPCAVETAAAALHPPVARVFSRQPNALQSLLRLPWRCRVASPRRLCCRPRAHCTAPRALGVVDLTRPLRALVSFRLLALTVTVRLMVMLMLLLLPSAAPGRCPPLAASRCFGHLAIRPDRFTCLNCGNMACVYEGGPGLNHSGLNHLVLKQPLTERRELSRAYGVMEREICTLGLLRQFAWAPKVLCVDDHAYVMQHRGGPRCRDQLPVDYEAQVTTIVKDMQSIGVRHNDMLKPGNNDFVVDSDGRVSLVDFGWASVNGSFAARCTFQGAKLSAPNRHPTTNANSLLRGIQNLDETNHSVNTKVKCTDNTYTSQLLKRTVASRVSQSNVVQSEATRRPQDGQRNTAA